MNTTTNNQTGNNFNTNPGMNTAPSSDLSTRDKPNATVGNNADVKLVSGGGTDPNAATTQTANANAAGQTAGDQTADATTAEMGKMEAPAVDNSGKKDQLQRRVTARMAELEKSLGNLQGQAAESEHAKALRTELTLATDAVGSGWEHVSEVEASRLSKWLDATQVLVDSGTPNPPNAEAQMNPANGEVPNTALPADGAVATDGKVDAANKL